LGQQLATRFLRRLPAAEELTAGFARGTIALGALADVIAFHLPLPTAQKLDLLAEPNVIKRVEFLLANLPADSSAQAGSRRPPPDFSPN
jgi:hypothetical protein